MVRKGKNESINENRRGEREKCGKRGGVGEGEDEGWKCVDISRENEEEEEEVEE